MAERAAADRVLANGRLDLERELLAAVCVGGAPVLLTLRAATPWSPAWLTGARRLAAQAVEYLARRGEAPGPLTADAIAAEVARCGAGEELAAGAREVVADAIEAYGGQDVAELGRITRLVDALGDAQVEAGEGAADAGLPALLPGGRLLDAGSPPVEFAIAPYYPKGELTEICGAHGLYKSTLSLGAALSVTTGRPWGPCIVEQGRAVFITLEDSERTLARRLRAWLDGLPAGEERDDAEVDVRTRFFYLAREHARDLALTSTTRTTTAIRAPVVEHLSAILSGCAFVVAETATRLHEGPETNEALAVFAQAVEQIAVSTGAALSVPRHVSKAVARDGTADSYSGRGGGAFSDAARSVLVVTRERKDDGEEPDGLAPVRVTHAKSTHSAPGVPIIWRPVPSGHGVYLAPLSTGEAARADAARLLGHLRALGAEGLTRTALHKAPPAGLGRTATRRALDHLMHTGEVREVEGRRGRTGQPATVYVATGIGGAA